MNNVDLYRSDPAAWAETHFIVDRQWMGSRWAMKPGPIRLADYQKDVLREALSGKYAVCCWSEPGKSGKSTLAGLANTWAALHKARSECYCIANDLSGTGRVFKAIEYAVKHNQQLHPKMVRNEIQFKDGFIRAIPADYRGEAGADPTIVTFDEVEHFMYSHQSRLVGEFKTSPTRDFSLQWFTGYGGWEGESILWSDLLNRRNDGQPVLTHIRNSDGGPACWDCGSTFIFYSDVLRQPWQDEKWIKTQEQNLTPSDFKRIVLNQFVAISEQSFVQPEWWASCYNPALSPIKAGDGVPLVVAVDLARGTVGGDTIGLVAVCKWGQDGIAVKYAQSWQPTGGRFDYDDTVGRALHWLVDNCNVLQVAFDPYEAGHFIKPFREKCWCKEFSQQSEREKSDRWLYDLIAGRKLQHYNDETLNNHVAAAGANVKGDDRLRIVKAGRKKIDLCVSLSMCAFRASQLNLPPDPASLQAAAAQPPQPQKADYLRRAMAGDQAAQKWLGEQGYDIWRGGMIPAQAQPAAALNGLVLVRYEGHAAGGGSFSVLCSDGVLRPVEHDQEYLVSGEVYANLKSHFPASWWVKVS